MSYLILDNISLILLIPLWIFLIIMCGRFFSVYVNKKIIYILTLLSSFLGALVCSAAIFKVTNPVEWIYPFIKINNFVLDFGLRIDKFSLIMGIVLFVVSFCVQLFSVSYMKNEKKNYRFFALLNFFNFSMAFAIFSPNMYQLFVFWELVSIASYLFIGFDYKKKDKSAASKRVFIINKIGDTALAAGIIITSYFMYSYSGNFSLATLSFEDFTSISTVLFGCNNEIGYIGICLLFIIAAMVKSAQIPFYTWLQNAMRAQLPVSALLHSATMVALGVYLIVKMHPFFELCPVLLNIVYFAGILTAIICSALACIEIKPKKILAYSTSANLGLMFAAAGINQIKLAILLYIAHAFIKSALFLSLPRNNKSISQSKIFVLCFASLSLILCMPAKELMYDFIQNKVLYILILILSAVYVTRLVMTYTVKNKNRAGIEEIMPFILLLINIFVCFYLNIKVNIIISFLCGLAGVSIAVLLYKYTSWRINTPKISELINNKLIPHAYAIFATNFNWIENHIFSNYKPVNFILKNMISIINWIETYIMNGCVYAVVRISKNLSGTFKRIQSGNIQTYNAYAFILFTLITVMVILSYTFIFSQMS